uniref:MATH domain-containing protein n=1 Tax=Panagrolaimus sp. ES5 TaxID=591445 RepID=A0AC34FMC7_9BILA
MQETMRGPIVGIRGVPWRIMVMPRQHVVQKKGTQKCLGFFLQCCPTAYSDSWSCQASAELRLISQKAEVPNFTRKTSHSYTAKENDWGYSCFMTWADILDESQGYIKDNTVKVEVVVKAEPPKNILDHAQFQKKIREYIRLADVQASRGYIDKAIEVNTSASKFCKDKDVECKNELETQLKRLIELKLKESIERIEKGNTTKNGEEDSLTNINALRQAMGGGSAARSQKAQKVVKKDGDTATKDAARKQAAVVRSSNNKCPPRSMEDMRRDIEKQVQKTAAQKKAPAIPACNRQISGLASTKVKAKTNGTTTPKIGGSTGRLPDSPSKGNTTGFRKIFDDEMRLSDNDDSSNDSTENINLKNPLVPHGISDEDLNLQGSEADLYVGENQISVKLNDEPDFNLHIAKVMETLKDISPDFHEAMRKTFRNPLAMAYSEEDSFMEELYGGPQSPPVHEVSVQTEAIVPVVTETAVVDAATSKALPQSPDDKGRKVKRVRKTRGKQENDESGQCGQLIGDNQQKGILEYEVSGLASASNSSNYPGNSSSNQQEPSSFIQDSDEASPNSTATRYFNSLPMNVAFDFIERIRDNDNPERPGALPPGEEINSVQFIDLMFRQNINDLVGEFVSNGQAFHVGVANNIFKTFPGYQPNRPLGAFEQRLVTNALNVVSLYKFFHTLNMSAKASAVNNCMSELEATIKGTPISPSTDRLPEVKMSDPPLNPLEFNMYDDPDYLLDKSYRRLHEYLVAEMRFIVNVFSGFDFSYAETVTEAVKLIQNLRLENERLKKMDEDNLVRQQELEKEKEHEMNEIRNSNNGDKDKINELNKQIKELKKENKRLEKKAKQSDTQSQEVTTLRDKFEKSEEKLAEITTRFNDLSSSNAREKQSWQDTKANYVREKQSLENDVKSLKAQLEESRNKAKKLEEQFASEKKSNQNQLKSEKERAIKAECSQLETTLEFGVKILERAQQDCKIQIRHFESLLKNQLSETDQATCNKGIQAWKEKIEEIKKLITNAKAEFHGHIGEIKKGKTLATLPKITVPKPPPQPVLPPLTSQQPPQQIQQQQQQQQQQQAAAAAAAAAAQMQV